MIVSALALRADIVDRCLHCAVSHHAVTSAGVTGGVDEALVTIIVTPLRLALERAGASGWITHAAVRHLAADSGAGLGSNCTSKER